MLTGLIISIIVVVVLLITMSGYVKASPNKAYVITGLCKKPKVLIGKSGIKIPFLQKKDELLLKQISIDIKTGGPVPTHDFIGVDIDAVAKVRCISYEDVKRDSSKFTDAMAEAAMRNFLNASEETIIEALTDSLQGNMREIIGSQDLKQLCQERKAFGDSVQEKAQPDMNALGIYIESCNIQRLEDEKGLINALGQDNMSQIQKNASIAKAMADKEVAIASAEAQKDANDARVKAETIIAEKNNELEIKKAELKKISDVKKAEADVAYKIQSQEQRKVVEVTTANADIAKQERDIELKRKEAEAKEQELNATIKKQADADKYAAQQKADADLYMRQKEAEAKKFELEREAEAKKVQADAAKYQAEQEAAAIKAKGLAEAEAIKAKALAEAEGIEKKAEAQAKMKDASVLEMYFDVLPEIAKSVAEPLGNIDKITMYGDGNTSKMVKDITLATQQITEGLTAGFGFDLKEKLAGVANKVISDKNSEENVNSTEASNDDNGNYTELPTD